MLLNITLLLERGKVVSFSSQLTKERILECATQEFLEKGFSDASIREIATRARVTTGAIYNHFGSKDNLFNQIVKETADNLMELFIEMHEISRKQNMMYSSKKKDVEKNFQNTTGIILAYFYDNWVNIKLIFKCSKGSKYETLCEEMIEIEEENTIAMISAQGIELDKTMLFLIHVLSSASMQQLIEVVSHDLTREEAFDYMMKIEKFYAGGIEKLL